MHDKQTLRVCCLTSRRDEKMWTERRNRTRRQMRRSESKSEQQQVIVRAKNWFQFQLLLQHHKQSVTVQHLLLEALSRSSLFVLSFPSFRFDIKFYFTVLQLFPIYICQGTVRVPYSIQILFDLGLIELFMESNQNLFVKIINKRKWVLKYFPGSLLRLCRLTTITVYGQNHKYPGKCQATPLLELFVVY